MEKVNLDMKMIDFSRVYSKITSSMEKVYLFGPLARKLKGSGLKAI